MANPNMTRFKAMSMDEWVETIEQSAQEALKAKEEIKVAETTKAQRRGLLFIEGVQRIIDQLQNDPNLIEMTRILDDDPVKSRGEPSGPELI
jgi:ATP-dependent protease HslVU (ClpYQ) ATPase subunit